MSFQNPTLEDIVTDSNLIEAYKQVRQNKGSAGVDGMDIIQAHDYIMENLDTIRKSVLDGRYKPQPVRRVYIPKDYMTNYEICQEQLEKLQFCKNVPQD
jgi:retron-type reverse transcriptase